MMINNKKSSQHYTMANENLKFRDEIKSLNKKDEERQYEIGELRDENGELKDTVEEQQYEIDRNHKKIKKLESKNKIIFEKYDGVRNKLQKVEDELKSDNEEQKFLVVIGELVSKVYDKIYYTLTDDDTPEIYKLPSNVCFIRFFKNASTKYRHFLDYALNEIELPFDNYWILVSVKNARNNTLHQRESVAKLIEDLESSEYTKYNEAKRIILEIQHILE